MDLAPLGRRDLDALTALAQRPEVARFGEHLETDPAAVWEAWLGEPDPHRRLTIAARDRGELACAVRVAPCAHRRRVHAATIDVLAPWDGADAALDAALGAALDAADRWLAVSRLELTAPAGHPRVAGLYARHGFAVETVARCAIARDGALADEVSLARLRPGIVAGAPVCGPPAPPPRRPPPSSIVLRPVTPDQGARWARALSEEGVLWGTLQLPWQRPEWWQGRLAENDPRQLAALGIEVDGELAGAGVLVLGTQVRRRHAATLGMHLETAQQGRGLGARLLAETVALADRLGLSRVALDVFADNERALRLYERAGFAHEGRRRLPCFRDGALVDDLAMARVRE